MNPDKAALWERFQKHFNWFPEIQMGLDLSRIQFAPEFFREMQHPLQKAFVAMEELEKGGIANPDEKRMVGHYWLRCPDRSPASSIETQILEMIASVKTFADQVHQGIIHGSHGPFKHALIIGIGGSALGPQFVAHALGGSQDKISLRFFDNTDPDGMDKVLASLAGQLGQTLCIVISKSGGTKETRNGMLEAQRVYEEAGLRFSDYAVAVTGLGSELDLVAEKGHWIRRFPMWDWVGGRTSVLSAVGLLPAALQGIDIEQLLLGARMADTLTRKMNLWQNPAAQLALVWFSSGNGKGLKDMVVLPYKDRLELFSKYLQQLIMESLGKELSLDGTVVNQGLAVYGNKGATDQHAYVQQLRDGLNNFFVTFIEVLKDRQGPSMEVEPDTTSGDYLQGFFLGTRHALFEKGRESVTITVNEVSPFTVGVLIALFERAVGIYALLINVNVYHQPGVEAGKKAAGQILSLQRKIMVHLREKRGTFLTLSEISVGIHAPDEIEHIFKICEHLVVNRPEFTRSETVPSVGARYGVQ